MILSFNRDTLNYMVEELQDPYRLDSVLLYTLPTFP